jgi:hypothetical protein
MTLKPHRVVTFLAIGSIAVACGEPAEELAEEQAEEVAPVVTDEPEEEPIPFDSLPMPAFPEPQRGRLVVRGAGPYMLDGAWPAVARMCDDPAMIQIIAQEPGIGTLVLLQLPPEGQRLTDYPVTIVEQGAPVAPASQVGVQLFEGGAASAFQAMEGQVSVYDFGSRVSGRFGVILRDISSGDGQKYAGVFESVPIEQIAVEDCLRVKEAMQTPDSAVTDTIPQ